MSLSQLVPKRRPYIQSKDKHLIRGYIRIYESHFKLLIPLSIILLMQIMVHFPQIHEMMLSILSDESFMNKRIKALGHMTAFLKTQSEWKCQWLYWLTNAKFLDHLMFNVLDIL